MKADTDIFCVIKVMSMRNEKEGGRVALVFADQALNTQPQPQPDLPIGYWLTYCQLLVLGNNKLVGWW
jgi:hypothetical protein